VAWLEWQVTKQLAGEHGIIEDGSMGPNGSWFRNNELGFGKDQGPDLLYTLLTLKDTNAKSRKLLAEREGAGVLRVVKGGKRANGIPAKGKTRKSVKEYRKALWRMVARGRELARRGKLAA
jgi:hypothetical protein